MKKKNDDNLLKDFRAYLETQKPTPKPKPKKPRQFYCNYPIDEGAEQVIAEFIQAMEAKGNTGSTLSRYGNDLRTFFRWIDWQELDYLKATKSEIEDYNEFMENLYAPKTLKSKMGSVRSFYQWLCKDGKVECNPVPDAPHGGKKKKYTAEQDILLVEFQDYLQALNRSQRTIDNYILNMGRFLGWLHSRDIESLLEVTWRDIERYQGWMFKQPQYCAGSVETYMTAVKVFYKYLRRQNYIIANPCELVSPPRTPDKLPRNVLSEDEMQELLNAPDNDTDEGVLYRCILEVFYCCGLRRSELCSLSVFDIDTGRQEVRVQGKGDKPAVLPLSNEACMWLRLYMQDVRPRIIADKNNTTLFVGHKLGRNINPQVVENTVRKFAKQAGITKTVSPHTIRATTATHLLQNGASLMEVRDILRHELVSTTQRYTRLAPKDLADELNKKHPSVKKVKRAGRKK